VNRALAAPADTVTVRETVTAELLLESLTANPPLGAAAVSVTVQAAVPAPVTAPLLQDSRLKTAGVGVPVPLRLMTGAVSRGVAGDSQLTRHRACCGRIELHIECRCLARI
jgi:hypothetical protein